jgi:hypothetical protein
VLVLTNPTSARAVSVQLGENSANVQLDENSVTTLVWG